MARGRGSPPLFMDTCGCGAESMAMNEHELYDQFDQRIPVLLTMSESRHAANQRVWYQNECGFLAGVLPAMTDVFDALLRQHGMTPLTV